jgi:KOW motif
MANISSRPVQLGDSVRVASGPHEGRSGQVVYMKDQAVGNGDAEPFAIIRYPDAAIEKGYDEVAVPVRRLKL